MFPLPLTCSYIENHKSLTLLFPYGALSNLSNLYKLSHGNFILFCADKAYSQESDLVAAKGNPHLASHGSFSFMTNFHSLAKYVEIRGGMSLFTPYLIMWVVFYGNRYISGLKVCVFIASKTKKELKETFMNIYVYC